MLKFQNNNTTVIATFEDFILTTYVIIDELYHQFALPEVAKRRHVLDAKLSDSEIITISLCGELLGVDSENAWFSLLLERLSAKRQIVCSCISCMSFSPTYPLSAKIVIFEQLSTRSRNPSRSSVDAGVISNAVM